jgi:hypothetical protein
MMMLDTHNHRVWVVGCGGSPPAIRGFFFTPAICFATSAHGCFLCIGILGITGRREGELRYMECIGANWEGRRFNFFLHTYLRYLIR